MSKIVWKDLAELSPQEKPAAPTRADEFGPEVALALAQLRAHHGLSNASCQSEGNKPENVPQVAEAKDPGLDALRDELQTALPGVNRRGFLQLTGAAAVFAMTGCWHKDPDTLVPYYQQPEGTTLGKAVWYSSIVRDSGRPMPVMVKTYDGRPIKLEGNPDYAPYKGKLDTQSQAALLNLYDPDRRRDGPRGKAADLDWDKLDEQVGAALATGGVGLITGPIDGAASRALIDEFASAFKGRFAHAVYDAYAPDAAVAARMAAFGDAKPPVYHVDKAQVLVTLGSDFLGGGQTGLGEQIAFGEFRKLKSAGTAAADHGQVICFEPTMSQTGTVSDLRIRVGMDKMIDVAWALAREVAGKVGRSLPGSAPTIDEKSLGLKQVEGASAISYVADRLVAVRKAGANSLVYVGGATHSGANSTQLHVAANFINEMLGNEGVTVETASHPTTALHPSSMGTLALLLNGDAKVKVETLIVVNCDPAHALPNASDLLKNFKNVVVVADRENETYLTAAKVTQAFLAPTLHALESWGDAEFTAGAHGIQQPCIQILWDCRAAEESLMAFAVAAKVAPKSFAVEKTPVDPKQISVCSRKTLWQGAAHGVQSWRNYVQRTWLTGLKPKANVLSDDRTFWNAVLSRGVLTLAAPVAQSKAVFKDAAVQQAAPATAGKFQLVLSASRTMRDGANLNNAWLQEMSDPVSKITWDNYLAISVKDAIDLKLAMPRYDTNYENPVAKLTVGKNTVLVPVHVQEGQQPGTLELFLGWGRSHDSGDMVAKTAGVDGSGINAFALRGANGECWGLSANLEITGQTYRLACTQGHNKMEGRDIARDDVLELHREDPAFIKRTHHKELWEMGKDGKEGGRLSMWATTHTYPGRRWGMVIDMNTCIACNACVVACQAENNVPVVGRDEVRKGREMHWIRIDRYYAANGNKDEDLLDVEVFNQPMLCQHCAHAPCEEVCPPMATMHNDEGVNVQIYNRCIGTRYCSNNCPYKVRRFNYYEYSKYRMGPVNSDAPFTRIAKNLVSEGATSSANELSKAPLQMLLNPVVTVRSKGVMEKCNFCVQRTRDIREGEKANNKKYQDGSTKTACAQTCPTDAITFGDINDDESQVSKLYASSLHAYHVLDEELNTRPSVAYLRRMRNRPATADERKKLEGHTAHEGGKHEEKAVEGEAN